MTISLRAAAAALVLGTVALGVTAWSDPPAQQAGIKIAFVDSHVLLRGAPGTDAAQALLQRETASFDAEVARMSDSLKKMQKNYQEAEPTLSPAVRTQRQTDMQATLEKFTRASDSLRNLAETRQRDLLQPVIDNINRVLQEVRSEGDYVAIFDLGADNQAIVAYDKNRDITTDVMARVKKLPAPTLPPTILKGAAPPIKPPVPPAGPIKPPVPPTER
jgi:outer membrane protein